MGKLFLQMNTKRLQRQKPKQLELDIEHVNRNLSEVETIQSKTGATFQDMFISDKQNLDRQTN